MSYIPVGRYLGKANILRQSRQFDHEKEVCRMADSLIGKYVNIEWYDPDQRPNVGGMSGVLSAVFMEHPSDGYLLLVDYGYGVPARYVTKVEEDVAPAT